MVKDIRCPRCGQSDQVEKVSTIYLVGIGLKRHPAENGTQENLPFKLSGMPETELRGLARKFKPPAATRRLPSHPLHPDLIVITFSLILPIFIFGIVTSQPQVLLPVLGLLALMYGLYFWKRKAIVARFENRQFAQRTADERVRQGIERWMKLYYCASDDGVFIPGSDELISADQMNDYLMRGDLA